MRYLTHLLERLPLARAAYFGDIQGNYIYFRQEPNNLFLTEFINRETTPPTDVQIYTDLQHREIKRKPLSPPFFDPRTHSWFKLALDKKETVWTSIYEYEIKPPFLGITVVTPVFHFDGKPNGVFGIDVKLDLLANYIGRQKVGERGEVFIVDRMGNILVTQPEEAPTNIHVSQVQNLLIKPWIKAAFNIYRDTGQSTFQFNKHGISYLATFEPISVLTNHGWLIGVIDRADDFTHHIYKIGWAYLLIALLIFIAGVALISHLVTQIVIPIKMLVKETKNIKNFNLEEEGRVTSHIKEVTELSDSIYAMKMGLRSFKKYVPATLVRQLIKSGEDVHSGGIKRELAVFFSDIRDFTSITEKADSNALMKQLCEYMDAFSRVIIEEQGTVDKYIGDAIMAFWGAPIPIDYPSLHAATAALLCMKCLETLNAAWIKQGKPPLLTRMGIHFGETIVGNLGSSERLNYTAIGDAVNIASRLVSANKNYGTTILVSDFVYQQLKEKMVLRFVDQVTLKGKEKITAIYELLAKKKESLPFDVEAYQSVFKKGFFVYQKQRWQAAIEQFNICLQLYPGDTLALAYIKRCEYFILHPPASSWDGVWHFSEK